MIYGNEKKLKNFDRNTTSYFVMMDFDRTMTTKDSPGSWNVLENPEYMPKELIEKSNALIQQYYPYELNYSITKEEKESYLKQWYYKNMNLLYEYHLTYPILLKCVENSNIIFRDGLEDFLKQLYQDSIPVVILSAGIVNIIYELLKMHHCLYSNIKIISNFIDFDKDQKMLPYDKFMIHTSNKNFDLIEKQEQENLLKKDFILVFGDLIEDLNMLPIKSQDKSICFGFLDKNIETNLSYYKNSFDIILSDNASFETVNTILKSRKLKI